MKDSKTKFRRWPLYILGSILLLSFLPLVLPGINSGINLPMKTQSPGPGHWMGTDALGRDLLASLIIGASRSLLISIGSGFVASAIGIFVGSIAGFFGGDLLRISLRATICATVGAVLVLYFAFVVWPVASVTRSWGAASFILLSGCFLIFCLYRLLGSWPLLQKKWKLPFDQLVQRFTEVFTVIPRLYLIVVFALILPINVVSLALLLALTSWVGISRLVRAEMIRVRSLPFIESSRIMGLSEWQIYWRHALPNSMQPVATEVCFTLAGLLIAESTLSFLGIGISPEVLSWGSIIHGYLENPQAWWLAVFPGLLIYFVVVSYHAIGNDLDKRMHLSI